MSAVLDLVVQGNVMIQAAPICPPDEMTTALDTAKFWLTIIAAGMAVVALILVGIGMFFQHRRGDGGEMLKALGWWIGGVVLVAAAAGIAAVFIPTPDMTNCVKSL
ncbi:MAG: TrbC/VirB2 family protein [Glutamicibacter sp.]